MLRSAFAVLILFAALVATVPARAQDGSATPAVAATPTGGCDTPARDEPDLAALEATAQSGMATPAALGPIALPEGGPVDAATLNELDATLSAAKACAEGGFVARLLALYSDAYVTSMALAPEPVPIVPGRPDPNQSGMVGTPSPSANVPAQVEEAVLLADGRIAARVSAGGLAGTAEIVVFTQERGRWVIDAVRPVLPEGPIGGDLPFPVQAAVAAAAAELGADRTAVTVVSFEPRDWGDTSLGCPKEGEVYAQVITPGYLVLLTVDGRQHEYHTDGVDRAIRCDPS